jgi:hypothetical protein
MHVVSIVVLSIKNQPNRTRTYFREEILEVLEEKLDSSTSISGVPSVFGVVASLYCS